MFRLALALPLALTACVHPPQFQPGLDFKTFQQSHTAIGGVAIRVQKTDVDYETPEQITGIMEDRFRDKRRDLQFVPAAVFRERVTNASYAALIADYRDGPAIDSATYAMLADAIGGDARFLALARIESVFVTRSRDTRDPDYNVKTENDNIVKTTHRNVSLTFDLFDLEQRRVIWNDRHTGSSAAEVTFKAQPPSTWGLIKTILSSEPDYPPPPDAHRAIDDAFKYFAARIPKK